MVTSDFESDPNPWGSITSLLLADEWNRFLTTRKALRVSTPRSLQHSSYFLPLPLKYSVSLTVLNTLLHWLVSQCVFVVAFVEYVTPDFAHDHSNDAFIIGFLTIAVVLAIAVGALLFLAPLPLAWFWRLRAPDAAAAVGRGDGDGDDGEEGRRDRRETRKLPPCTQ
ncbi:hypothetical protein IWX90DRAFT_217317 [Phyllosticta citrichinensis]|uniref:Uncharacterized protein n=1 Tax=Phyllosticta citrichinensis TaxID=1130410 RepID=A0ABR1XTF2_9PEZI